MPDTFFHYDHFFEISLDLLCIAGFDGYFKKVNQAVCDTLEYSADELYSRPINSFIHPDDRVSTRERRESLHRSKPLFHFENRYITKTGRTVWLSWTSKPVIEEKLIFAIAKDVTHKKKIEEERLGLMSQLSQLNEQLKQVTLKTSHDLRSPVNNLLSVFSLLDVSDIEDIQSKRAIELIKLAGDNLKETLNKSVDMLKESLLQIHPPETVDFKTALNSAVASIQQLVDSSGTQIYTDFSDVQQVVFNSTYLESIFLNLITNSIKYSNPDESPEIKIRTRRIEHTAVQLILEDNGKGFDAKTMGKDLFTLKHRDKNTAESVDSKGVGLFLVHNYITSYGGSIDVESDVGKGTRFTLTFPS